MSYGQPCDKITTGPAGGPASAYPTFKTPASICFITSNDLFDVCFILILLAEFIFPGLAFAKPIMLSSMEARLKADELKKRRRSYLCSLNIRVVYFIHYVA